MCRSKPWSRLLHSALAVNDLRHSVRYPQVILHTESTESHKAVAAGSYMDSGRLFNASQCKPNVTAVTVISNGN